MKAHESVITQSVESLIRVNGISKVKDVLLSQSIRASISHDDRIRMQRADRKEVIELCVKNFKWYSTAFAEIPKHFESKIGQQVESLLKEFKETVYAYFRAPGRVLTRENKLTVVTDSEYEILTDSQRDELHLTVLDVIGECSETDLEVDDHDIAVILSENAAAHEELTRDKTGELATLKKGYVIGPNTQFDRSGFQPKHPTSPLCWVLTQSQLNYLFLAASSETTDFDGTPDHCTASESETEEAQDETSTEVMVTTNKGYRICLSEVGSLCDRSRHFSPFFLAPPPSR